MIRLRDWRLIQLIERKGYFLDEHDLPISLTETPIIWITPYGSYQDYNHYYTDIYYHTHVSDYDVTVRYGSQCDIVGKEIWPTFAAVCDIHHFRPTAISQREAKMRAVFARKYGAHAYHCKYVSKKHQHLLRSWKRRIFRGDNRIGK